MRPILLLLQLLTFILIGPFLYCAGVFRQKRKFVIGTMEIANNVQLLSRVFPDSFTVNFVSNPFYKKNSYNFGPYRAFSPLIKPLIFAFLLPRATNFFYIWSTGFFTYRSVDFIILKLLHKKIITLFCGDDIRSPQTYQKIANELSGDTFVNYIISTTGYGSVRYEDEKQKVAEEALKFSDFIFNYPVDNISRLGKIGTPFPYIIDDKKYTPAVEKFARLEKPLIVHAPSNSIVKGTALVRAAIKKLEIEGYQFRYEEIINKPNEYVNDVLSKSHIVLNQFYAFAPGLLGIEAMLLENVVLMSADPEVESFPHEFEKAYVKTRYWEVYDNLKHLLDNKELLPVIAAKGRAFVLSNYSIEKSAQTFRKLLAERGVIV